MQYDSEYNLTFHIYFSGLLEIVLLVQQRTVRVHCAAGACSSLWGGNVGETSSHFVCGLRSRQMCAPVTCVFINYVCVCYACVCACPLVTVARLSERLAGGSRL